MRTRLVTPADRPAIQALIERFGGHGLTHDWDDRVFAMLVAEDDEGHIVGASTLRWQAECYLGTDPSLSRRQRVRAIAALVNDGCRYARRLGITSIYAPVKGALVAYSRLLRRFRGVHEDDRQQLVVSVAERCGHEKSTPALWGRA